MEELSNKLKILRRRLTLSRWHPLPEDRNYRIYGVDFDGTLYVNGKIDNAFATQLKALQDAGNFIVLYTSRVGEQLDEALRICEDWGLIFDDARGDKPYCDYYIDENNTTKEEVMRHETYQDDGLW